MSAIPYVNSPLTTVQDLINQAITNINAASPAFAGTVAGTASSGAATANGTKVQITTESLTTAAAATYTLTLTNSAITAASFVYVSVNYGSATTGEPCPHVITPTAGQVVIKIRNDAASAALNGTLVLSVMVF